LDVGFKQAHSDPCLFYKRKDGRILMVGTYVDDLLVVGTDRDIGKFATSLGETFDLQYQGELSYYLGIQFHKTNDGSIFIYQKKYISEIEDRFSKHLEGTYPRRIPMQANDKDVLIKRRDDEAELDQEEYPYRELIGCLMYASVCTRPDISFAVNVLARFVSDPAKRHWDYAIRVLNYLRYTPTAGVYFDSRCSLEIKTFTDAAEGDPLMNHGQTGIVLKMKNGGAFSWTSVKQKSCHLDICYAEQVALTEGLKDVLAVSYLHEDLAVELVRPLELYCDNEAVIKRIKGAHKTYENRFINRRMNFTREYYDEEVININHISGSKNPADMFTKPLPEPAFILHREEIGMRSLVEEGGGRHCGVNDEFFSQVSREHDRMRNVMYFID